MDRLCISVIILHLSIVAKKILLQRSHYYRVWNYWQQNLLYCICYIIWIGWHMMFGLEQEGGSLIDPMPLAHPLHPIDYRSKNRRQNLWVLLYEFCFLWFTNCVSDNSLIPGLVTFGICFKQHFDTRYTRRVGVWWLPWLWHILFIPLTTGLGTGAETCGLDVFPPDDLCSRPEALCEYMYTYIYIYARLYESCFLWFTNCLTLW